MKRMLSLVLSLILAWSLTIPSLAAEDLDPPLWQQMGFSSREECITYVYGDEDAYEQAVQEALERQQWEDAMADDIAAFDPDAYWESDECQYSWSYDSKEEFMEDWFLETEEEFRDVMLEDWLDQQWDAYRQETLGGPDPGGAGSSRGPDRCDAGRHVPLLPGERRAGSGQRLHHGALRPASDGLRRNGQPHGQ